MRIIHDCNGSADASASSQKGHISLTISTHHGTEHIHLHGAFEAVRNALERGLSVLNEHERVCGETSNQFSEARIEARVKTPTAPRIEVERPRDENPLPMLVSRKKAAAHLSISLRTIAYMIAEGKIKVRRIGGRTLIPSTEVFRVAGVIGQKVKFQG